MLLPPPLLPLREKEACGFAEPKGRRGLRIMQLKKYKSDKQISSSNIGAILKIHYLLKTKQEYMSTSKDNKVN